MFAVFLLYFIIRDVALFCITVANCDYYIALISVSGFRLYGKAPWLSRIVISGLAKATREEMLISPSLILYLPLYSVSIICLQGSW